MTSIMSGLDFYKLTMSQQAWKVARDAQVTFTLKNRTPSQRLLDHFSVEDLEDALAPFVAGFSIHDVGYLSQLPQFTTGYRRYLLTARLPIPQVSVRNNDVHVEVTGDWPVVTFWETVIMSTINDLYFAHEAPEARTVGHERLTEAIEALRQRPDIRISDFGTRRRFGLGWQGNVIERMKEELPEQFVGTSNPYFAKQFGLKPIGTFAHEMPMVYAAQWDSTYMTDRTDWLKRSHDKMLDDWFDNYGYDLSIALTDTFGSDFFFRTFGKRRALSWKGLRHDSGDPFEFGLRALDFYKSFGIDHRTKTLVFSDGLDLKKILALHATFKDEFTLMFGWGTGLTNNMGIKPLNIVMKATSVDGYGTVKLSDDEGKHTGSPEDIARYLAQVQR